MDISHEEFVTILKKKDKYEKMKDNLKSENAEYKIMRWSSLIIMLWRLLLNAVEAKKKRGITAIDGFRKKMIPDSEIRKCPEFEVKSKIGKIFKKHNPLEEYSVRIYKIDPYSYEHYKKNTSW